MASVTENPQPPGPPPVAARSGELLVDQQIGRTRRALKFVDMTAGLITLLIGVLAYLLTMAVLEHWVVPGGWSDTARALLFALLVLGVAGYSWHKFWPLLRQPINPAYAAQTIEQGSPTLKNSLLNLLLLRSHKREMSRQVYQAIEDQAAQRLSQVRVDSVVDRSAILRLGYILVAITAICVLYRLLSPKDLFSSAGRVLLPWSDIATPSRVQIFDVTPGDTKAARGERVKITAEVHGLDPDEPVRLLYSTADKQIVGQEIPMTAAAGGLLYSCQVPSRRGSSGGLQQDLTYWIEAGDARSPRYQIAVFARPTMVVNRLRYDFPAYTGFPSREVEHTGDIQAVEGTKVTLFAQANKPIQSAHVDFDADGRRDLLMKSNDQQATITFPLSLRDDRRTPQHRSYLLRYTTTAGNQNENPPKYKIDVQPDYAPEIQLLTPEEAVTEVALNEEVNFELEARDPDFALSQVLLLGQVGQEQKLQTELLTQNHTGRFVGKFRSTPEQMGLQVGDVLEYWGAAADNRKPEPNIAYSAHRKIKVVGPWQGNEQGEDSQEAEGQQQGDSGESQDGEGQQEGQAGGSEQGNTGEGGEGADGQSGQGEQGDQSENSKNQGGQGEGSNNGEGESASADGQNQQGSSQGDSQGDSAGEQSDDSDSQEGGQPSEDPSGGQGDQQGKVSSEGDDDSSAFERIAEHFNEQDGESDDNSATADGEAGEGRPDSDQTGEAGNAAEREGQPGEQNEGPSGDQQSAESEDAGAQGEPAPGEEQQQGGDEQQEQDGQSPDGQMSPEQGDSGAGDQSGDEQGAPNADDTKKPQDKQGDSGDGPQQENGEAAAKSRDQSESDSEGGQGGDRSGGGQKGAGQQSDEQGKGAAGQNEAADQGAGRANEQGEGETGEQAGDQQKAEGQTGESSGDQKGQGSEQSDQPGEQQGGESPSSGQDGEQGAQPGESNPAEQSDQQASTQQSPNDQPPAPDAAGQPGEPSGTGGKPSAPPPSSETAPGDEANLEYAKKQTDLILDRLEDQLKKKQVDQDLLKKLGWTQDELRRFVNRWKNLKAQADDPSGSDDAANDLNEALRSLGLNPNRRTGFQSKISKDKLRDLQDAYRGRVPLEYQEQVNRYLKGTASSQEKE